MSRIMHSGVAGAAVLALIAGSFTASEAAPLPAQTAALVGGHNTAIDTARWRGGPYGGYGYRRGYAGRVAGAVAAGAALGIIGGALAAGAGSRYGDGDPAYGDPAYGYGYAPVRTYAYPAYDYPVYGDGDFHHDHHGYDHDGW